MTPMAPPSPSSFKKKVWNHYRANRRDFPWRNTRDPYKIFVSEVMLQQTQAPRVVPKYEAFTKRFPDFRTLAASSLADVLVEWKGLGYNRRALNMKRAAEAVVTEHGGLLPKDTSRLVALPGIGPNTAGSIAAFAHNEPAVFIETNIRSVYIHEYFEGRDGVHDREILPLVESTLDRDDPREWYYALMDYGVHLKKTFGNPSRRSTHHSVQTPFRGSRRELRSKILAFVLQNPGVTATSVAVVVNAEADSVRKVLAELEKDGLLARKGASYSVE